MLTYAPAVLGNGTLTLNYAYDDDAGVAQTGTLDVPYEATTNDNVTATPSPTGPDQCGGRHGDAERRRGVHDRRRAARHRLQITSELAHAAGRLEQHRQLFACTTW